jgi:hypothetical protein
MWARVGMLNAERAGDLGDGELPGHSDGRRWHHATGIAGHPVPAPDALQELPNAESEGEPGHQTNQTPKRNR